MNRNQPRQANRGSPRRCCSDPNGFTLIELTVTIGIISLLASLILPAAMRARESARRVSCVNRLRQVALAITANEEVHRRLPASGNFSAREPKKLHSWVTTILPQLDQTNLANQYDLQLPFDDLVNQLYTSTHVEVFVCPSDISVESGHGNLSYVVNCGFAWTVPVDCPASLHVNGDTATITPLDYNGNGVVCPLDPTADGQTPDITLFKRTSLFFVENWPPKTGTVRHHQLEDVVDGFSQTIMVSENVRAGYHPKRASGWASPDPLQNAFFVSSHVCHSGVCSDGQVDFRYANDRSELKFAQEALNGSLDQAEGTAPWPSAMHGGVINFAFCDGHVISISENIDGNVYAALITPQGRLNQGVWEEAIPGGDAY